MPVIPPPPSKVLVTGANGFIAMWIIQTLLEQGYSVRGVVRTATKGRHLLEYFSKRGFGPKDLEIVVVEDFTKPGAFNEAVIGVDAIEHTASPIAVHVSNPQDFIKPAVQGTVQLLQSVLTHGSNVRRVVITSSGAAILAQSTKPTVFSEEDWNTESVEDVEKNGINAKSTSGYRASKTLAEKAAWEFYKSHQPDINWDLVVIDPPVVIGPPLHEIIGGPQNLNESLKLLYDLLVNDNPNLQKVLYASTVWVDVRDIALAHVLALQKEEAGGERIVVSTGPFVWQEWLDVANDLVPYPFPNHPPPKGIPGLEKIYNINFKTEKQEKLLGMSTTSLRTMRETMQDTLEDFAARGW